MNGSKVARNCSSSVPGHLGSLVHNGFLTTFYPLFIPIMAHFKGFGKFHEKIWVANGSKQPETTCLRTQVV